MRKKTLFILIVMFMFLLISCDVKTSQEQENVATYKFTSDGLVMDFIESLEDVMGAIPLTSDEVHSMQTPLLKDLAESEIMGNIPESWDRIWDSVAQSEGPLTDEQIKVINHLLQPYFMDKDQFMKVNPISCFFTSNYSDARDIDLTEFLRYAPIRESMDNVQEFDLLKVHPNWPFAAHLSLKGMPVPIHRYQREAVEALFYKYAGIRLDELSGIGFDEVIYLEATDAYYNYTSDFGPGVFICEGGEVKGDTIRLFGKSNGNAAPVLTLIQYEGRYVIKAFE